MRHAGLLALGLVGLLAAAAPAEAKSRHVASRHVALSGIASVYSYSRAPTASGQRFSPRALTAAHRSLPFGTVVRVVNRRNGRSVDVVINDRGPFVRGRVIDLTPAAARSIGFSGLAPVTLSVVRA
jgi:rare lipoprotein A